MAPFIDFHQMLREDQHSSQSRPSGALVREDCGCRSRLPEDTSSRETAQDIRV